MSTKLQSTGVTAKTVRTAGLNGNQTINQLAHMYVAMKKLPIIAIIAVSGCTSNTLDIRPDSSGARVPSQEQAALVRIVEVLPDNPGRTANLSASICPNQRAILPPSRDDVLLKLKTRALMNGFTALADVEVGPVSGALERECPRGVRAQGVGFFLQL